MFNRFFIFLLLPFSLASCIDGMGFGSMNATNYEIVPPTTEMGAMCANNCLMIKSNCENFCADRQHQDRQMNKYIRHQNRALTRLGAKNEHYFDSYDIDDDDDRYGNSDNGDCFRRCLRDYHICHQNCGGKVISYQRTPGF